MTAKQLEADTGCKIMVRGRGSMRDKQKVINRKEILISFGIYSYLIGRSKSRQSKLGTFG